MSKLTDLFATIKEWWLDDFDGLKTAIVLIPTGALLVGLLFGFRKLVGPTGVMYTIGSIFLAGSLSGLGILGYQIHKARKGDAFARSKFMRNIALSVFCGVGVFMGILFFTLK